MANGYLNPYRDEPTFASTLKASLRQFGGDYDVKTVPLREYVPGEGWRDVPGRWMTTIRHPDVEGGYWRGIMTAAPNRTMLVQEGIGYRHYIGETKPAGPKGIQLQGQKIEDVVPYYSGIESFSRRLSAAFYRYQQQPEGDLSNRTVNQILTGLNQPRPGKALVERTGLGGQNLDIMPGQPVWLAPEELTEQRLTNMAWRYVVAQKAGRPEEIAAGIREQLRLPYLPRQVPVGADAEGWWKWAGGGTLGEAGTMYMVGVGAGGPTWVTPSGELAGSAMTETWLKHKHIGGLRPSHQLYAYGKEGAAPLEAPGIYELPSITNEVTTEPSVRGLRMQAIVPMTMMPAQSGMGQFWLGKQLKEQLSSQGQTLRVASTGRETVMLGGGDIKTILESGLTVDKSLIGKPLEPGKRIAFGSIGTGAGMEPMELGFTASQQRSIITGYTLHINPEEMLDEGRQAAIEQYAEKLGIRISPSLEATEKPYIAAETQLLSEPALKVDPFKVQINAPALYADPEEYYRMKTSGGYLPYNILAESKSYESLLWSSMKSMPTAGENNLYDYLRYIFPESAKGISAYEQGLAGERPTATGLAGAVGADKSGTPAGMLKEAALRTFQYTSPMADIDIQRNVELLNRFSIGRVGGVVPVEQYTKEAKQEFIETSIQALMSETVEGQPGISRKEAEALVKQQYQWRHEGKGIYRLSVNVPEAIYAPVHAQFVPEMVGVGSTQGLEAMSLRSQGFFDAADYLTRNKERIFRQTPSADAIRQIQRSWQYTQAGKMPDLSETILVGEGGIDPQDIINAQQGFKDMNDWQRLRSLGETINKLAGRKEGQPNLPIHFLSQGTTIAHPLSFARLETDELELLKSLGFGMTTGSYLSTKMLPSYFELANAEGTGRPNQKLRARVLGLQEQFLGSELIYKSRGGGIFAHATLSNLLMPGKEYMSEEGVERMYRIMGGTADIGSKDYWNFVRTFHGSFGTASRPPYTASGSEGVPGAIQAKQILTPFGKRGGGIVADLAETYRQHGLPMPELIASALEGASQIDADKDPRMWLSLMYGEQVGGKMRWNRFIPNNAPKGEYEDFMRRVAAQNAPMAQIAAMRGFYAGGTFMQQMPLFEQIQGFFLGAEGRWGLGPSSTATTQASKLPEALEKITLSKERGMGTVYNVYGRRGWVAAADLGAPDIWTAGALDVTKTSEYSEAVDMRYIQKFWDTIMGSAGFLVGSEGKPIFGAYKTPGEHQPGDYTTGRIWEPAGTDISVLTGNVAKWLGTQEGLSPMGFAAMMMDIPEWKPGGMNDLDYAFELYKEQKSIAGILEPAMKAGGTTLTKTINELVESGRFSERSLGINALLTRAMEYGQREHGEALIGATQQFPLRLGAYGNLNWQQTVQRFEPASMLYDFLLGDKSKGLARSLPQAWRMLNWFRESGSQNQYLARHFHASWGQAFNPPWAGPPGVASEEVTSWRRSAEIMEQEALRPWARVDDIALQLKEAMGRGVRPSELAYPGKELPPREILRAGKLGHRAVEAFLKSQGIEAEMEIGAFPGMTTGRVDVPYFQVGDKVGPLDIKISSGDPTVHLPQMASYNRALIGDIVSIGQVPRETLMRMRQEELLRARASELAGTLPTGVSGYQFYLNNLGGRVWQEATTAGLTTYPAAMANPSRVEESLRALAQAKGIQIQEPNIPPIPISREERFPANALPSTGGAQTPTGGGRAASTGGGGDFGDFMNFIMAAWEEFSGGGGGGGDNIQYRNRRPPKNAPRLEGIFKQLQGALAEVATPIGEGRNWGELAGGTMMEAYENLPETLANLFPEYADVLSKTPISGLSQVLMAMQEKGVDVGKTIKQSPLGNLLGRFARIQKWSNELAPAMGYIPGVSAHENALIQSIARTGYEQQIEGFAPGGGEKYGQMAGTFEVLSSIAGMPSPGETLTAEGIQIHKTFASAVDSSNKAMRDFIENMKPFHKVIKDAGIEAKSSEEKLTAFAESIKSELGAEFRKTGKPGILSAVDRLNMKYATMETAAKAVSDAFGAPTEGGRISPEKIKQLRQQAYDNASIDQLAIVDNYTKAEQDYNRQLLAAATGEDDGGMGAYKQFGRMTRRMLGGFGLMYMRSLAGIITGGTQMGYAEGIQQRAAIETAMGARFGGMMPVLNPEEEVTRAEAGYGGLGWSAVRRTQAGLIRGGYGTALAAGGAALGGAALAGWLGMMAPAGSALANPLLAPIIGGIAALGTVGMTAYGAAQVPELSGVQLAQTYYDIQSRWGGRPPTNLGQVRQFAGQMIGGMISPGSLGQAWAGLFNKPQFELMQETRDVMLEIRAAQDQGQNISEYLRSTGRTEEEIRYYTTLYQNWRVQEHPTVPVAGLAEATALETYYGLGLTQGAGGTYEQLSMGLAQNIPYEQMALTVGYAPGLTTTQIEQRAGSTIEQWLRQGGLTAADMTRIQRGGTRYQQLGPLVPTYPTEEGLGALRYAPGIQQALRGRQQFFTAEQYMRELGDIPELQFQLMAQQARIAEQFTTAGFEYQFPRLEDYTEPITPEQYAQQYQQVYPMEIRAAALAQYRQAAGQLGVTQVPAGFGPLGGATTGEMLFATSGMQAGLGVSQTLIGQGVAPLRAEAWGNYIGDLAENAPQQYMMYQGMLQGDPRRWVQWARQRPATAQALTTSAFGGFGITMNLMGGMRNIPWSTMFHTDISPTGEMTGLPWGTTSLATGLMSSTAMGAQIFGANAGTPAAQAMIEGGQWGLQRYQLQLQAGYQATQAGIQFQRLALQREYQPQFWSIEDRQRQLGYAQQEWQFGFQERQMEMQNRFWEQNFALQQEQAQKQRGWTREDYSYQDQIRNLQWGWRVEDFGEQVRFMTGRDRRLAERQMRRDVIMHGLEGDQIDRQRARQEEIWQMEDKRFDIQRQQHEETVAMQEEQLAKSREFYEQRKALEEESVQLQRKYWEENMQLSEEAARASAAYAAAQQDVAERMQEFQEYATQLNQDLQDAATLGMAEFIDALENLDPVLAAIIEDLIEGKTKLEEGLAPDYSDPNTIPGDKGSPEEGTWRCPRCSTVNSITSRVCKNCGYDRATSTAQRGGRVRGGQEVWVGEMGPEKIIPSSDGYVIPSYRLNPWEKEQTFFGSDGGSKTVHMILNVGGYQLAELVTDIVDKEIDV